jgi:hypothetical protein
VVNLATVNITCDLKNYCFSCVVDSVPRDFTGKNVGYHCKICKIDILCPAGVGRQYDKKTREIMDVCPKCGSKLEKGSYLLNNKIQKGYRSPTANATANSPLGLDAEIEVSEWVFWAKPGDIAEVKANISPCIGNKQLNCLIVVLNTESCFAKDLKQRKSYISFPADAMMNSSLKMDAKMEMPNWVFWAKPGDIADVKAKVSPCIGNRELECLVVILGSKSCFST